MLLLIDTSQFFRYKMLGYGQLHFLIMITYGLIFLNNTESFANVGMWLTGPFNRQLQFMNLPFLFILIFQKCQNRLWQFAPWKPRPRKKHLSFSLNLVNRPFLFVSLVFLNHLTTAMFNYQRDPKDTIHSLYPPVNKHGRNHM